nr:hypothetical protein [Tanacetum cinerariifolium]
MPVCPNLYPAGLLADPTGSVTPFVCWIEDYPLPDGLKMPSHVVSYDGKILPEYGGYSKAGSILNCEDLKVKLRSHFSQQKRFTKTHLVVHNIKQREGESVRAFATRNSLYIQGFVEKTYTWIEAREIGTNRALNDQRDNFERLSKSSCDNDMGQKSRDRFSPYRGHNHGLLSSLSKSTRENLAIEKSQIEESVRSGQLSHLIKGIKKERAKASDSQRGEKKEKSTTLGREITFPLVTKGSNSSAPVVIKAKIFGREVDSQVLLVGFLGEKSWAIEEVLLEITIGDAPLLIMCRFGVPQIISLKDDMYFKEGIFADLYRGLKITQSFSRITEHIEIISRIEKLLTRSQQGWADNLPQVLWIHKTLPRNNQKETLFSLTYGSEAIILTVKSNVAKDEKERTKEVTKRKEIKEVALIEEAYYQHELHMYHNKRRNHSTYKVGDFVLLLQNNTENPQEWQGPHMIREVPEELYKTIVASDHSLIQTVKGINLHKFYM